MSRWLIAAIFVLCGSALVMGCCEEKITPARSVIDFMPNDGLGRFPELRGIGLVEHGFSGEALGDVNRDGLADLVMLSMTNTLAIQYGPDLMRSGPILQAPGAFGPMIVADLTGDTHEEIVLARYDGITVHLSVGTESFVPVFTASPYTVRTIQYGHFRAASTGDLLIGDSAGGLHLWLGTGAGTFSLPAVTILGTIGGIGDLDGDTVDDLITLSNVEGLGRIYLADGSGGFAAPTTFPLVGGTTQVIVTGRFDAGPTLDVAIGYAVSWPPSGGVSFMTGDGSGNLTQDLLIPMAEPIRQLHAVDLDGNGVIDLVGQGPYSDYLLWNNGSMMWGPGQLRPAMGALEVADITGDGRPDLVHHWRHPYFHKTRCNGWFEEDSEED